MATAGSDDGPFEVDYPEGVPYSAWNFNVYTMATVVKKICFGHVKTNLQSVVKQLLPGTTQKLLQHSGMLDLDNCFLANQRFVAERVGSMPEDVPIIQPIRQPVDSEEDIMRDVGLSFECDYNLCFTNITASENTQQNIHHDSPDMPLQLKIIPSVSSGRVDLSTPANVEGIIGLENLCVHDRGLKLLSSELLIEQMYNILTIITAIMNVYRIQQHHKNGNVFDAEDRISLNDYLQYVGQAGPAVHVVMCMSDLGKKGTHLYLTEDVSLSVPCKEWPSCAKEWPSRDRPSGWPSQKLIDKVMQDGCHVVPKFEASGKDSETSSHNVNAEEAAKTSAALESQKNINPDAVMDGCHDVPKSDASGNCAGTSSKSEMGNEFLTNSVTPNTQWRYSFSLAERTLMTSITEEQKMCYLIFKYLFSRYIKLESVITTYTAKTIFLWALETVPTDQWTNATIGDRVKDLMEELRTCVKNKYCQHYFITGCNTLQQMDDHSRRVSLENGFSIFDEHMAEGPDLESRTFETTSDFPVNFMFTYKPFYVINVWLESLNAQMMAKLDPPSKLPSEKNVMDLMENSKTHPILMSEILKYLVLSEEIYGQPLPIPNSLLQHKKVTEIIKFLEKSITTSEKYQECMTELDVELKFLHLQYRIIDEIEEFLKENPTFAYSFVSSSDESESDEE